MAEGILCPVKFNILIQVAHSNGQPELIEKILYVVK